MKSSTSTGLEGTVVEGMHSDGFLPYMMEINNAVIEYAENRRGETSEKRARCLQELRDKLKQEKNLLYRDEDKSLLKFLRARKFEVRRAASMVKKYYSFLESHRDFFGRSNPEFVERFLKANIVSCLPYRDSKGRAIVVIRAEAWNCDEFPPDDVIFGGIVSLRSALEMEVNQIMGFVVVLDLKGFSIKQVLSLFPKYLVFGLHGLQYCCPCKVSAIHVLNFPEVCRIVWKMMKPLVSDTIRKRITFHKKDSFNSLDSSIPKEILPTELGGDLGPMDNSHWGKDVDKLQLEYTEEIQYGYKNWKKDKQADKTSPIAAAGVAILEKLNSRQECNAS